MAFNNGFPMSYPQMYAQSYQQPQMAQNQGGIIWIQGENAAKSYLVAPNSTVVLFDSESQTIYLKSADSTGLPSMRILDYTIRDQKAHNGVFSNPVGNFATKDEMDALRAELEQIKARMNGGRNESAVQRHEPRKSKYSDAEISTVPAELPR